MTENTNLEANLRRWMLGTGFPLEMATAEAFRQAGFEVRQGSTYKDSETHKGREIDVVAVRPDILGAVEVGFVMECKSSKRPWVVLKSIDTAAVYNRFSAFCPMTSSAGKALIDRMSSLKAMKYIHPSSEPGYGLRQAFDGEDNAYAAAVGAVKASLHFVKEAEALSYAPCAFFFPLIVVDTPIFECTLLRSGELSLSQVNESEILFSGHLPERAFCRVKIATRDALPSIATWARDLAAILGEDLEEEALRVWATLGSPDFPAVVAQHGSPPVSST